MSIDWRYELRREREEEWLRDEALEERPDMASWKEEQKRLDLLESRYMQAVSILSDEDGEIGDMVEAAINDVFHDVKYERWVGFGSPRE